MLSYKIIGLFSNNGKSIQIHHIFIGVNAFDKSAGNTDFKIMKSVALRTFNLIFHLILLTNTMEQLFKHIVNYGSDNFWMTLRFFFYYVKNPNEKKLTFCR